MSVIGVWLSCAFCSACMAASLSRVSARCRLFQIMMRLKGIAS